MTVKDLKDFLADKPDDLECIFSIWKDGECCYRMNFAMGDNLVEGTEGRQFLRVSWVDDCPAYRMVWENNKLKHYGER